jgi:hypothetical protein
MQGCCALHRALLQQQRMVKQYMQSDFSGSWLPICSSRSPACVRATAQSMLILKQHIMCLT